MAGALTRVVLASQSPRRRDLLDLIGVAHEVRPADVDESVRDGEAPDAYTQRLAREKAAVVAALEPDAVVVAADTTVVIDGEILGKPADAAEAEAMVRRLAGRAHEVYTGIAVRRGAREASAVERVRVTFRALSEAEVRAYVATGEPMDKAGAYGIQGYGATIVERIDGDYFAVMGLSLVRTVALLREVGAVYPFGPLRDAAT
ncbi:Maf family protein [Roseisolibacter sp. H3M3-2]|uniref:Maf family protein n=1 Tax=Roseisolibacter sp. H3M3-2 TaxID=3031323 RepID=UPI0023DB7D5F|nr:Maf family protein [Roseisolibacter sp. H3M3-2]MDF1501581.1 Maf family protein [Roseisolibacter sp. H3M3-2]